MIDYDEELFRRSSWSHHRVSAFNAFVSVLDNEHINIVQRGIALYHYLL